MRTLKEYEIYLENKKYLHKFDEFCCGILSFVSFIRESDDKEVILGVRYETDYIEEIEKQGDGYEYIPDYSRIYVTYTKIPSTIVYLSENVIELSEVKDICLYNDDLTNYFEKALWISDNEEIHCMNIMGKHIEHLEKLIKEYKPILEKYNFKCTYNSFFDISERRRSEPEVTYYHPHDLYSHKFFTNPISEEFYTDLFEESGKNVMNLEKIDSIKFEELLIRYMQEDKRDEIFGYLFDKDPLHTIDTYCEMVSLWRYYDNPDKLPDSFKPYIERLPKKYEYIKNIFIK